MTEPDLKRLFQKHARALQSALTSKARDPHLAADLVQESFLRLAEQGKDKDKPIENAQAYLYRTAQNLLIDHARQQQRRRTDTQPDEVFNEIEDQTPSLEDQLHARQRLARVRSLVAELPPRTQRIFELNRIQGQTYSDVARQLGISDSSVQKHLASALAHVMAHLEAE